MSRSLDDLTPEMRAKTDKFLAKLVEKSIHVMVIDTLRTDKEHEENIRKKVSWTKNSKHLPQAPSGKSNAIDICPYHTYQLYGPDKLQWDANDPAWLEIGEIGESCGLTWGGRWKKRDMGHFEL